MAVVLVCILSISLSAQVFKKLAVPKQISPKNKTHFTHSPRNVTLRWTPVRGAAAYDVEIDCLHCRKSGQWDSQNGPPWKTAANLKGTGYSFVFPGDNQGRWRVRASRGLQKSKWSPRWYFDFKTGGSSSGTTRRMPDLVVKDIRLIKNCKIQVTIKNIGTAGVPSSSYETVGVQMYKGNQPWGGIILKGFDPPGKLKVPGGTATHVWFPLAANLDLGGGTHTIKVIADHGSVLPELNETNNTRTERLICRKLTPATGTAVVTATKPPVPAKTPKRFLLHFKNAYLGYIKSSKSIQIIAEKNVLSYGGDWQKCQLTPTLFHLRENFWKGFYWEVNTAQKVVYRVKGGSFCKGGGTKEKLNMTVKVTGDYFYLYFSTAYLVYVPSTKTLQVTTEGNVLSYGSDWQKCNLKPYLYELKQNVWQGFYWKINTSKKQAWKITGAQFCSMGGTSAPLANTTVQVVD
jgi:hypothetical protein